MSDLILNMRLIGVALFVLAAVILVIFRSRQARSSGLELKSHRQFQKVEKEKRCPHFRDEEVKNARKSYVRPDCAQVDPANELEFRKFASVREPIFSTVDRYIQTHARRHLLILADSGMGKTTFCLNYFRHLQKTRPSLDIALISLARSDALNAIDRVPSKRTTTLILDAFDEDTKALVNGADRLVELMDNCADFPLVIVTCRSHFFENDAGIPIHTGISRIIPRSAGRTSSYEFSRLYLLPFDEDQIDDFLKRSFSLLNIYSFGFRKKARALIKAIPDLSARPMLLALVPELVRTGKEPKEIYELYDYMVEQWLLREEKWVPSDVLLQASMELSFYLSETKQITGVDRIAPERVKELGLTSEKLQWRHLTTRSLLNRDSEGNLKFAHRSIMEFLVVRGSITGDERATTLVWTDFMREILLSYAFLKPDDKRARSLLQNLLTARATTHFPYSDQISQPLLRTKSEIDAIANPARSAIVSRHTFPTTWLPLSFEVVRQDDLILVEDFDHGLHWRFVDLEQVSVGTELDLFKIAVFDLKDDKGVDGYTLPSLPEVLTLLRIQLSSAKDVFFDPSQFYWIGDKSDRGSRMLFSLHNSLEHPAATLMRSDVRIDGRAIRFNLYALDPYKFNIGYSMPRAFQALVRRRDVEVLNSLFPISVTAG